MDEPIVATMAARMAEWPDGPTKQPAAVTTADRITCGTGHSLSGCPRGSLLLPFKMQGTK